MRRRLALVLFGVLVGCGRLRYEPVDVPGTGPDAPELDAPGLDAPTADTASDADVCPPVIADLAGFWTMDAMDVAGGMLADRSGTSRDGRVVGDSPVVGAGRVGGALDFSATPLGWAEVDGVPFDTSAAGRNTVAFWMRRDTATPDEGVLCVTPSDVAEPPRYCLWLTDRDGLLSLCFNGGTGECWGIDATTLLDRWVHVVAVFANGDTTASAFYVDGLAVASSCRFGTCDQMRTAAGPLLLGMNEDQYAWHGLLDSVRFYPRALSADEVARLYACESR